MKSSFCIILRILLISVGCNLPLLLHAQTYYHPTSGLQNTYAGNCEVNTCSGTYVDNGGAAGNYANGVNSYYRTFCPNISGRCIRLTFSSFALEPADASGCDDLLTIGNGPTQGSPSIWQGCGTTLPPVITSTDRSGCITVRFTSDLTVNAPGWVANITCVPCAGAGPSGALNNDCANAEYVCDNLQVITANSEGPGLKGDVCVSGCALSENYSNWYVLSVIQPGTLGLTIDPTPNGVDYDFSLYGPVSGGCGGLGNPIRCSFAANTGNTGLRAQSNDASEGVAGDGWVSMANVVVGTYYLMVNQWSYVSNSQFQLDFSGTAIIGLPAPGITSNSPLCGTQALQLVATPVPGAAYFWSGPGGWISGLQNPSRNPPVAGTYTLYYIVNGCTSTTTSTTVILNSTTATISPASATICSGQSVTLTASAGTGYLWSNSASTQSITVSPAATTTYNVLVTSAGGCTASASSTVTVASSLTASISPPATSICNGQNITLTASGGANYSWSNSAITASITVNPLSTTTYSVTATSESCSATSSRTVTVNTNPTATILPATVSICNGASTTLTASGGTSYSWSNTATTASITVNPATTTTYTVTVTNASSCTTTSSRTVTVNTNPTAIILPAAVTICNGGSATLTASGGTSYSWSNAATTASITVNPATTTTYTVTVTNASSCTATSLRTVTVNTNPTATILPATVSICNGSSATLAASGGTSYSWSNAATTASITVNPATTTTYTVTVTNASSCTATTSRTVTVNTNPTATILPATVSICNGSSATLTASGGTSYSWSNATTTASITVNPATTTTYTMTVTNANNCTATTSRTVTVNANPTATISPATVSICNGASSTLTASGGTSYSWSNATTTASITVNPTTTTNYTVTVTNASSCTATSSRTVTVNTNPTATILPAAVSICNGGSATLTASGGTSYSWSNAATTASITVNPATTTTYTVTVTNASSCTATSSRTVNVNTNPTATILPATVSICYGASTALTASGGTSYSWSNAATTASIILNPAATTTYTVTVTNANSCTATTVRTVTVNADPTATILPATVSICNGSSATLTASGGTSYSWSNTATTTSITVNPPSTTSYNLTVTDINGCTATTSIVVTVNPSLTATILPGTASICIGDNITLTASGGTNYSWSNSATTNSISVTPSLSTTYSVTVTDGSTCSATTSRSVTVNANPTATILPATVSICTGSSTTLTASGGTSYSWSNTGTTASVTVNPAITAIYNVTVTNANSCTSTISRMVTVNANPTATILPATVSICSGSNATLTASGGTSYSWSNAATTASITVNPAGTTNYNVTVSDINGCTATTSRTVTVSPSLTATILSGTGGICFGDIITLTASGGTTYSWSNSATTPNISVNPSVSTTYSVTVTDGGVCSASESRTVTVNANPTATILPATISICNGANATLTASGGTSYSWSNAATTSSITVNPLSTTSYSVTVTDVNGCTAADSKMVTVNLNPTATILPGTVSICNGANATLTANGGTSYSWSNAATTASITVNPVSTTIYSVTVTDSNSCSASDSKTVTVNSNPTATILPTTVSICNGGSATLTASGGTSFSWNNSATTPSITVNPVSTTIYSVTVTDANSCSASDSKTVTVNANPTATISPATVAICSGSTATLTASGGTSYSWSNAATTASITVNPVTTTSYSVTLTDANNCSATTSRSVTVSPNLTATILTSAPAICSGESVMLTASGGTDYSWSNAALTDNISVAPSATTTYFVTVTDGGTCSATASQTITVNPAAVASISPNSVSICDGESSTLTASGGISFSWSNSEITSSITVTPVVTTTYSVTAIDGNGCSATSARIVTVNPNPIALISAATVSICNGLSATLTASGGTTYLWSNSETTNAITVSPVLSTTYGVTVIDGNTCRASTSSTVYVNGNPSPSISPASSSVCSGTTVTLTAAGGTSFSWSNSTTGNSITETPFITTTYTVTATDANGCSGTASATVDVTQSISLTTAVTHVSCNGGSDGAIRITITGGQPPFGFVWDNGALTKDILNIAAGNYAVTVSDNVGCGATISDIVYEPAAIDISETNEDVKCNSGSDGFINVLVSGGTPGYLFSWNDGNTNQNRNDLLAGNYSVIVSDNNSCTLSKDIIISEPALLSVTGIPVDVACSGGSTGSIDITTVGGTQPYSYLWDDGSTADDRNNLNPSSYSVTVTDNNTCQADVSIIVGSASGIVIDETHTPVSCFGKTDGTIDVTVTGGNSPYIFLWNDGVSLQNRTGLSAGNYSLEVTDGNSCIQTTSISIIEPAELVISETHEPVSCNGYGDGTISIAASGGTPLYNYSWDDGGIIQNKTNLSGGNYSITVTDDNLCSVSADILISEPEVLAVSSTINDPTCFGNADDGSILLDVTGGTTPYQFSWSNGGSTGNINNLPPDDYTITITDANGCAVPNSLTFTLTYQYDFSIDASPSVTIVLGKSTVLGYTLTGNAGVPSIIWSPSQLLDCDDCVAPVASPFQTTLYTVTANTGGCSSSDTVTVRVLDDYEIVAPNVFSPNGDGVNDEFQVYGNLDAVEFFEVQIYNRWGEKLFESNDPYFKWDGIYRGKKLQPGVYVFQIRTSATNGKRIKLTKGSLTLIE